MTELLSRSEPAVDVAISPQSDTLFPIGIDSWLFHTTDDKAVLLDEIAEPEMVATRAEAVAKTYQDAGFQVSASLQGGEVSRFGIPLAESLVGHGIGISSADLPGFGLSKNGREAVKLALHPEEMIGNQRSASDFLMVLARAGLMTGYGQSHYRNQTQRMIEYAAHTSPGTTAFVRADASHLINQAQRKQVAAVMKRAWDTGIDARLLVEPFIHTPDPINRWLDETAALRTDLGATPEKIMISLDFGHIDQALLRDDNTFPASTMAEAVELITAMSVEHDFMPNVGAVELNFMKKDGSTHGSFDVAQARQAGALIRNIISHTGNQSMQVIAESHAKNPEALQALREPLPF